MKIRSSLASTVLAISTLHALATPAWGQVGIARLYDLPAQDLRSALQAVGKISGRQIIISTSGIKGRQAPPLSGRYGPDDAIRALLAGSGVQVEFGPEVVLVGGRSQDAGETETALSAPDIVVTGSRIRGAAIASPVIRLDQQAMLNEGHTTLASALKDIPGNFGGGQNSGVGLGTTGSFDDSGASTINLRGLGGDATLTVLNGHRLPSNADFGSIDISNIPFEAIDRIEIVPDGSSALYGSDAVAGVANIILKKDFDGVRTSARVGTTSDGGGSQRQYDLTAGTVWASGGVITAYDYEKAQPIVGGDRSYSMAAAPGLYLTPGLRHHNVLINAHEDIAPGIIFSVDALYNRRWSRLDYSLDPSGNVLSSGGSVRSRDTAYSVAPNLKVRLPAQWQAVLSGVYGVDRDQYRSLNYDSGASVFPFGATYVDRTEVAELTADGPLADVGAGDIRLAVGAGYRVSRYRENQDDTSSIDAHQSDSYVFGEISVPVISPRQDIPAIKSLQVSAAARYEDYPGISSVISPKLGIILSATSDFDLKASWGKSFKAPTFVQRFGSRTVAIDPASEVGGSGLPSTATALLLTGSNAGLKPERATSWTLTGAFHPSIIPGLRLELSYFHVHYRNRVVAPVTFTTQALSNPIYADLVNARPSAQEIADALAAGAVTNVSGGPFNAADVAAIVDDRYRNVASQSIHGVDASLAYSLPIGGGQTISIVADSSYLVSAQTLSALQPAVDLAGNVFNPPHFRAHGGVTWQDDPIAISGFVNFTGGLRDVRTSQIRSIGSMTTEDLTFRYSIPSRHSLRTGWDILLSLQNILNTKPPLLVNTQQYEQPYDAANFSPLGRVISVRVSKTW